MKRIAVILMSLLLVLAVTGVASAITFDEVTLGMTDPTIDGVSFWAGDPTPEFDTYTDDYWSPSDPYLMSGFDDGTGNSPGLYDTFIGASLSTPGELFTSVSFDILSEYWLPPSTTLWAEALFGGTVVASTSMTATDNLYHNMGLSFATGFDTLYIYDDLDTSGFGEAFHIDDFNFTTFQAQPVPEPATILLLGSGLAGAWFVKRKKRN